MQFHSRHQPNTWVSILMKHCPWRNRWLLLLILPSPPQDSFYQTRPFRWKCCPVSLISDLIQAWLLQFYPLWPSIILTEPTTKSPKQCCQTCPPQTKIRPRYSPSGKRKEKKKKRKKLHWLPVEDRIHHKTATLAFRHFESSLPPYLSELLHTYQPSRTLRSSSEKLLKIPQTNLKSAGNRYFHFQAAKIWNSLPTNVRSSPSLSSFKKNLKTSF